MSYGSSEEVLRLAQNFMESRIMLSGAELNLFTILSPVPLSAQEVASRIGADLRALTILLDALSAMGLLVKQRETYQCEGSVSPFLSEGAPNSVLPMVLHAAHLWQRWSALTDAVQGSMVSRDATKSSQSPEDLRAFIGAMDVLATRRAGEIVSAIDPSSSKILLDVGGALGTYTIAFLQAVPEMRATLFDKPEVVELARERLSKAGVLNRVTLVPGDFYHDELPRGHDLAFVSAIIHQNSQEQNLDLFKKVFRSLNRRGRIIIRDHVMEPDRIRPKEGAIFAVNMLMGTPGGTTYTYEEIKTGLSQAGFIGIRLLKKGEHMDALIEALKP
ncbi:MAG TPA: methyltransferase [Thermodesulfobacteriota bacterium]|nr:methyltransferase [Thermodesulfobacteriota bacterium]